MATRSKLAVILHADVVGSTALVRKDEHLAHDRVQGAFQLFSEALQRYEGVVHEIRGDALVAEFSRASDAVIGALAAQQRNAESNSEITDEIVPQIRVGIAMGEVVIADDTLTGAGVVLAQRLEQLAGPGGVCISAAVREAVPDRLAVGYSDLGAQEVKGFDERVVAYSVSLEPGEVLPEPTLAIVEAGLERPKWRWFSAVVVVVMIVAGGFLSWLQPWKPDVERADLGKMVYPLADVQSIAVLAFNNMSNDPEQEYFAEGIAEDIITDLSKIPELLVIARNSSFSYKKKNIPIRTIAKELGVKYVLEGSVRRAEGALRINAQLIDASTDAHLWAERYDGNLQEVFALQDRITKKIVTALSIKLSGDSERNLNRAPMVVPEAYDAFIRGKRHINARGAGTAVHVAGARAEFQKAIDLDPKFPVAYAGLGWANWNDYVYLNPMDRNLRIKAFELAEKSLSLSDNALARRLRARQYFAPEIFGFYAAVRPKKPAEAISELEKGIALEPNNADALAELAYTLVFAGQPKEATKLMAKAFRLNPNFPSWYHRPAGIAHYLSGDYERAIPEFKAWHEIEPLTYEALGWLAAAYAQAGDVPSSREVVEKLPRRRGVGNTTFAWHQQYFANVYVFTRDQDKVRFMEGLGKAGIRSALDD